MKGIKLISFVLFPVSQNADLGEYNVQGRKIKLFISLKSPLWNIDIKILR